MPARIAGGRLLLNNTIETASSEAAGHTEFDNETFLWLSCSKFNLVTLISTRYQIARVPPPTIRFRRKVSLSNSAWLAASDEAVSIVLFSRRRPPAILAGITYILDLTLRLLNPRDTAGHNVISYNNL